MLILVKLLKPATLLKLTILHGCFSRFLNCTNGNNKVSYNYLGSPTQAGHNSRRSHYSHVFFILFSCFNCGTFEKTLVTCNVQKPGVFIFPFPSKEQKSFKKYSIIQFICTIHTHMTCISMISSKM